MPCKKMSKDVSIPTFTIQYLMESGQGLTSNGGSMFRVTTESAPTLKYFLF